MMRMRANQTQNPSMIMWLTISLLITVVLVSIGGMSILALQTVRQAKRDLEQKADEALTYLTDALTISAWDLDKLTVQLIGDTFIQDEQLVRLRVTAFPDMLLYHAEKPHGPNLVYRTGAIVYRGERVGEVRLAFSKAGYQADIRRMIAFSAGIIMLILLAILLATNIVIRIFLKRPLTQLTDVVHAYAAGRYDVSAALSIHYREFQPFGDVLGHMGQKIMRQMEELQDLNAELEERVQQRTAELSDANHALRSAREHAEAANQAKSIFLANMSHELRTPLTAMLGFTQLMMRDPAVIAAQGESLAIMHNSGEYLLALINDVLEMSKIEAGRLTLETQTMDIDVLLTDLEAMLRRRAEDKGLNFEVFRAPTAPRHVNTDKRKLRQILLNLLSNAIKFTTAGSVTLTIVESPPLSHQTSQISHLKFEITDTGCGIAPEDRERIFTPFERATASQRAAIEGAGLGLALSRQFAELMGGDISVVSEPGRGSVFTLTIPVECVEPGVLPERALSRRVIGLQRDQPPYRILIVDDQQEIRIFLSALLDLIGFDIRAARNGREALEQYERWQPHLIWMDQRMPGMNGDDAVRAIRQAELRRQHEAGSSASADLRPQPVKIIALTANVFQEERDRLLAEGCDDVVRKPFKETEIFETLAQHLGVAYEYEAFPSSPEDEARHDPLPALSPADLSGLPQEWLAHLRDAAMRGRDAQVLTLIAQIEPGHAEVAWALRALVAQFRFDLLVALTGP